MRLEFLTPRHALDTRGGLDGMGGGCAVGMNGCRGGEGGGVEIAYRTYVNAKGWHSGGRSGGRVAGCLCCVREGEGERGRDRDRGEDGCFFLVVSRQKDG